MAAGRLRAVVCTSSLDLGIDWGDIDLVINVGAPKGSSRLLQRIGRANHRMDEPSRGVLVPANRFEVLECRAAIEAVAENAQDTPPLRTGALDVLAQHVLGCACGEPFLADELYDEVRRAAPYAQLTRADFDDAVDFVATGGYALKIYERFAKIKQTKDGRWRIAHPRIAQRYRMNVGTIVEADMLKVRLVRSRAAPRLFGPDRARREAPGPGRGVFRRDDDAGRHLRVLGRDPALRSARRRRSLRLARARQGSEDSVLRGRQISALDLSGRARAQHLSPIRRIGARCPIRCANGSTSSNSARCLPRRARSAGRDVSARRQDIISSAIRSKAGSRTRRSACC